MSSISKAGIYIDVKQLLEFTYIMNKEMSVARSRGRGKRNYIDAINSYLGMIKGTSDIAKAHELMDAIDRKHIGKDYKEFKIYDKRRNP